MVYLVRHGRTAMNADGLLRGRHDPPLDDVGLREVKALGEAFARLSPPPTRVISGPLTRTRQTAAAIARGCGTEVQTDPRLIDRDYGPWTGEPADELRGRFGPGLHDLPEAEPLDAVVARARAVLDEQAERLPQGGVVLVAHDVVNRSLLHSLEPSLGQAHAIAQHTACWNAIIWTTTGWQVRTVDGSPDALSRAPSHDGSPRRANRHSPDPAS